MPANGNCSAKLGLQIWSRGEVVGMNMGFKNKING